MKLFRINKVEEFFEYPHAIPMMKDADTIFRAASDNQIKKIKTSYINVTGRKEFMFFNLSSIVFRGDWEFYYYDFNEEDNFE